MVTAKELREILHYDPETGDFTWVRTQCPRLKPGDKAGSINKRWNYIYIYVGGKGRRAHRLAWLYMTGEWPVQWIDHINGNGCDNRFKNLRECNPSQNGFNSKLTKSTKSGLKGATWDSQTQMWRAVITVNRKTICRGRYKTAQEAHAVYCKMAKEFAGEFYRGA